jgi:beta-N-acetylhexosaminidase
MIMRHWFVLSLAVLVMASACHFGQSEGSPDIPLEEKVGQMLLVGFRGTVLEEDSPIRRIIRETHLGGVVLFDYDVPTRSFSRNIESPEQVTRLIADLQSASAIPLLVAVDAEGGRINRLNPKYGFIDVPSHEEAGRAGLEECRALYGSLGRQLSRLGFNLNLAPVVDLNLNPDNPIIGSLGRSFSPDPENVSARAAIFVKEHHDHGVISTLKHFPGHGSSRDDSHLGLVDVTSTFRDRELQPYREMIRDGKVDAIMTAHIMHRGIDPDNPVTLSPRFLQKLLREDMGFTGVIISDDMQMGAISRNYGFEDALVEAVSAGCDILAIANNGREYDAHAVVKAHGILVKAVREGRIPLERIEASYGRILRLKQKYSLLE